MVDKLNLIALAQEARMGLDSSGAATVRIRPGEISADGQWKSMPSHDHANPKEEERKLREILRRWELPDCGKNREAIQHLFNLCDLHATPFQDLVKNPLRQREGRTRCHAKAGVSAAA